MDAVGEARKGEDEGEPCARMPPADSVPDSANLDRATLQQIVDKILAAQGDRFDPARFRYIEVLLTRVDRHRSRVAAEILQRVRDCIVAYLGDFYAAREHAEATIRRLVRSNPEAVDETRQLFDAGDFQSVQRVVRSAILRQRNKRTPLRALSEQLRATAVRVDRDVAPTLDEELRLQEQKLVGVSCESSAANSAQTGGATSVMAEFQQALQEHHARQHISRVLQAGPEDPGPLNPESLVIRTVSAMRDLSPYYAERFAAYLKTLQWLERAGERIERNKKRQGGRGKS